MSQLMYAKEKLSQIKWCCFKAIRAPEKKCFQHRAQNLITELAVKIHHLLDQTFMHFANQMICQPAKKSMKQFSFPKASTLPKLHQWLASKELLDQSLQTSSKAKDPITAFQCFPLNIVATTRSGTIKIFSPEFQLQKEIKAHQTAITFFKKTSSSGFLTAAKDGSMKLWTISKLDQSTILQRATNQHPHVAIISNSHIVISSKDRFFKIFDPNSPSKPLHTIKEKNDENLTLLTPYKTGFLAAFKGKEVKIFSHNGKLLSKQSSNKSITSVTELSSQETLYTHRATKEESTLQGSFSITDSTGYHREIAAHSNDIVDSLEISDGRIITISTDQTLMIWKKEGGKVSFLRQLFGHTGPITSLALQGPNSLITSSSDGTLKSWDLTLKKQPNRKITDYRVYPQLKKIVVDSSHWWQVSRSLSNRSKHLKIDFPTLPTTLKDTLEETFPITPSGETLSLLDEAIMQTEKFIKEVESVILTKE